MRILSRLYIVMIVCMFTACTGSKSLNIAATQLSIANTQTAMAVIPDSPTALPTQEPTATPSNTPEPTKIILPTETVETFVEDNNQGITLENGWIQYKTTDGSLSVALPENWIFLELDPESLDSSLKTFGDLNPAFGPAFTNDTFRQLVAQGLKFYAVDSSISGITADYPTTMNILVVPSMGLTFDSLVDLNYSQIKQLAASDGQPTQKMMELAGEDAVEFSYTFHGMDTFGNPLKLRFFQYLMILEGNQYVVTFAAPDNRSDDYAAVFQDIVKTLEFSPN